MHWGGLFLWGWSCSSRRRFGFRKRRHPEVDEMDEQNEILQDLREAAAWLFNFLP
jgi:hypothetical protein